MPGAQAKTEELAGRKVVPPEKPLPVVRHLYVHIPFCHRICPYCSFYKHTPGSHDIPAFFQGVLTEAQRAGDRFDLDLQTVYFGGGTPTLPNHRTLGGFLRELEKILDLNRVEEFTFEANPRTFDRRKIELLLEHGVNRISLGVQAWDEATLATLGRDHSPHEAEQAYRLLRDAGVPWINLDLMFSIPGQTLETWQRTLAKTIDLGPDHVSAYNLNYEEDTDFFARFERGEFTRDEDTDAAFFEIALEHLAAAGLEQYEISNYARPGCESLHNEAYWQGHDYLGLGPGAFSTVANRRWKNVADTALYTTLVRHGGPIQRDLEQLTESSRRTEAIALSLRTRNGVAEDLLGKSATERITHLVHQALARKVGNRLVLTSRGRLVADSVAVHLLQD
ncbi:MAG: radical SAM family heme chaperone HemW [Verrucomicrobiales bacterium]